jgi:hypothetical protein
MPILWNNKEYESPPLLFGKMPATSAAEAQYEERFAAGHKYTLCDFLFFRYDDLYGCCSSWDQRNIPLYKLPYGGK